MPAISLIAYARVLDQLAERIRSERDLDSRAKLIGDFKLTCIESRRLKPDEELQKRGVQLGEGD